MNRLIRMGLLMLIGMTGMSVMTSCSKDDDKKEDNREEQLYVRPWVDYPQSYIKFFDYRTNFRLLNVQRNGSALQVDYTLTNVAFGEEVELVFYMPEVAGHDDLGNAYKSSASPSSAQVASMINGKLFGIYGNGVQVKFMPNQVIRGSFTIKDFDKNALAMSLSCNVGVVSPKDLVLAYNRIDFVNIPVGTKDNEGTYENM